MNLAMSNAANTFIQSTRGSGRVEWDSIGRLARYSFHAEKDMWMVFNSGLEVPIFAPCDPDTGGLYAPIMNVTLDNIADALGIGYDLIDGTIEHLSMPNPVYRATVEVVEHDPIVRVESCPLRPFPRKGDRAILDAFMYGTPSHVGVKQEQTLEERALEIMELL